MNRYQFERSPVIWLLLLLALLTTLLCHGQDISPGITFSDGQRLTAAELEQLVSQAQIQGGFITDKPNDTTLSPADDFILFNAAANALYKISGQTLLYGNTTIITTQLEKGQPLTNDYILGYDSTGQQLVKIQLVNLWSNQIASLPTVFASNLNLGGTFQINVNGTNATTAISNLFLIFPYTTPFTNLPVRTVPTNNDELFLSTSPDGTNYGTGQIKIGQLFTNPPALATPTNNDRVLVWSTGTNLWDSSGTNPFLASVPIQDIGPRTIVFTNLPTATNYLLNTNITYPSTPMVHVTLVVTNSSVTAITGHLVGDEIDATRVNNHQQTEPYLTWGASASNVWVSGNNDSSGTIAIWPRAGGPVTGSQFVNLTNFNVRVYVTYFPIGP